QASLAVTARGHDVTIARLDGWTVDAQAEAPAISVSNARYTGLALHASLPALAPNRQSVTAAASMKAPLPVAIELAGTARETVVPPRDASHPRIDAVLERLAITYPRAHWQTERLAR